jgi:hypothetical protein
MIEGMAEYLSLGKKDAYTAMWMRDAYLNHDIPSVRDLTKATNTFPTVMARPFGRSWAQPMAIR